MAASVRKKGANHGQKSPKRNAYAYVDGTAVRRLNVEEKPAEKQQKHEVSAATKKNRERALQMNLHYVLFLTAAAVLTTFMCITFLQLRARNTLLQESVDSLKTELDAAILENDADYNRVMTGIDLSHVREVAENELGMTQAKEGQIVTYEVENGDYVRQYTDIPEE